MCIILGNKIVNNVTQIYIKLLKIKTNPEIITNKVRSCNIDPDWKDLLLRILEVDPDKRIRAIDALDHNIFKCNLSLFVFNVLIVNILGEFDLILRYIFIFSV